MKNQATVRIWSVCLQKDEMAQSMWCVLENNPLLGSRASNCANLIQSPNSNQMKPSQYPL